MQRVLNRVALRVSLCAMLAAGLVGCRHADRVDPADHLVAAPISARANVVLANLIQDSPIGNGEWVPQHGDPGCVELFGTLFAYRTGVRRHRDDLVEMGRFSARNESDRLNRLIRGMVWANQRIELDEITGTPALFVSGTTGRDDGHYGQFGLVIDQMIGQVEHLELDITQDAAIAYLLAEMYRQDSTHDEQWIEKARICADRISNRRSGFPAFGWAAIAKATGDPSDLERAKAIIRPLLPTFRDTEAGLRFDSPYPDYLSTHLFLAHGLADMAQIEPEGVWRSKAVEILDYVFSDMYFDGEFLAHHVENEGPADVHCTGCNFHALYLADRLYGDALILNPVVG